MIENKKVALIITTYNRPEYLAYCIAGVEELNPQPDYIILCDDSSDNPQTIEMIASKGNKWHINLNSVNRGIKRQIEAGVKIAFEVYDADIAINLDGDAMVKPNLIEGLVSLHCMHDNIVSGFNCVTEANPIISVKDGYVYKGYCNGINMCFNRDQYNKYILPSLSKGGNWDYNTSLACREDNKPFIITTPSLVQHLGIVSSMGHTNGGVQADMAHDF